MSIRHLYILFRISEAAIVSGEIKRHQVLHKERLCSLRLCLCRYDAALPQLTRSFLSNRLRFPGNYICNKKRYFSYIMFIARLICPIKINVVNEISKSLPQEDHCFSCQASSDFRNNTHTRKASLSLKLHSQLSRTYVFECIDRI